MGLVFFEDDNNYGYGHKSHGDDIQEAGGGTLPGICFRGVFGTTVTETGEGVPITTYSLGGVQVKVNVDNGKINEKMTKL